MSEPLAPFLLNTIKLIDPDTQHLLSDKTTIGCPCCGKHHQLYVRPINHPTYFLCLNCQRAYDSVLLHHIVTASDSLKDSLDIIIQNEGYVGKAKDLDCNNILKRAETLEKYNTIRDYTYSCLSKNQWLSRLLKPLQMHGLYQGSKDSDKQVLAKTISLVSSRDLNTKHFLGINVKSSLYTRKKEWVSYTETVIIPVWSPYGLSAYWFLGEGGVSDITYYSTAKSISKGGLAFVNETSNYTTLLATDNPRAAAQMHLKHRRVFGTPAPVVLFSEWTSSDDFKPLLGKKVIFLDTPDTYSIKRGDKGRLRVLQYAVDLDGSSFSTVSSKDLGEESSFDLMNEAIENNYSTYDMLDTVVRSVTYDFEAYKSLNLNRFFAYLIRTRKTYGMFKKIGKINTYPMAVINGRAIEETPEGYRDFITGEMYSNFIIELGLIMTNLDGEETEYHLVFKRNHREVYEMTQTAASMGSSIGPCVDHINDIVLKEGSEFICFIKTPFKKLTIMDLIYEFNKDRVKRYNILPKADYSPTYNSTHDTFILPTCVVCGDGSIRHYSTTLTTAERNSRAFCLNYSDLNQESAHSSKKITDLLIFEITAYLALAVASARNKDIDIKPLLVFGRDSEIDEINRAIPTWPYEMLDKVFSKKDLTKKKKESIMKRPAVVEIPKKYALKLGAEGFGYVLGQDFHIIPMSRERHRGLEKIVTYCFVHCLSGILKNGLTTLDEVRKFQHEKLSGLVLFVSSGLIPYKESPILTQEECVELLKEIYKN